MAADGFALAQAFVRIRPDAAGFRASATQQIKSALAGVQGQVPVKVDSDLAKLKLTELRGYLDFLTTRAWNATVAVNDKEAHLALDRIFARLSALDRTTANPEITLRGIARAQAQLLALDIALDKLDAKAAVGGAGGGGGLFGTKVPLFGGFLPGILGTIGGFHLLASTVLEFLSVLIPATVALGVFGAVGADTVSLLVQKFQTVTTVSRAMHLQLLPLGGDFARMEKAAQPQVYALLGDALQIAGQKTGAFSQLARAAGSVLDQLASRATIAIKSAGFSQFLRNAAPDLQKLGTVAGNIFGTIGGLLKGLAGVGGAVLDFFVTFTHVLEDIANSPITQFLFRLLDGLHGVLVYAGLLGTALVVLGRPLGFLAGLLGGTTVAADENAGALGKGAAGWKTLAANIGLAAPAIKDGETAVKDAGAAAEEGAGKTGLFSKAMGLLGGSFGWVGLAAAAVAVVTALAIHYGVFTSEADKLQSSLTANIAVAQNFGQVVRATNVAVAKSATVTGQLNQQYKQMVPALSGVASRYEGFNSTVHDNAVAFQEVSGVHEHFLGIAATENARLGQLKNLFGSTATAQGLMNQAGIKSTSIALDNKTQWAQDVQTLTALFQALKATAFAAGAAGQNEKILTYELSDQYTSVQKLNSGWDTFIGLITSTQSAFDTVANGITALAQTTGTLNISLGEIKVSAQYVKSNIDALTPSGIALNQAFSQQVTNFNALIDTWRGAGLSLNAITGGVRAAVATLLPFAAGSKEATAQLAALAAEAGYAGPADFRLLQMWVGNVSGAEGILKQTADEATLSQLALSGAFQSLGNQIAQHLLKNINDAILGYHGVYAAATAYGTAVAKFGQQSSQAAGARQRLVNDIYAAGVAAHQSAGQIQALIEKVLGIPKSAAVKLYMNAQGSYQVSAWTAKVQNAAINFRPAATGMRVPGYGGGDRHPIMAEGGEAVVPKHLVPAIAPFLAANKVPGFAAGGIVGGAGDYLGNYAQSAYRAFTITALNALIIQLRRALAVSEQAEANMLAAAGYGFRIYDSGGFLPPGMSMAYNGTGRPEPVGNPGGVTTVQLEWVGTDQGIFSALRNGIRVRGGLNRALGP